MAIDRQGDVVLKETYYSIRGGFILKEEEISRNPKENAKGPVPYPFKTAHEMLLMAENSRKSIAQLKRENEVSQIGHEEFTRGITQIWQVMSDCIDRGLTRDGILPGRLNAKRRAKAIFFDALIAERGKN